MIDVRLEGVSKNYEALTRVVDSVDLEVEHGKLLTLLGPSGCGKTTTLKMISGFEPITDGSVFIGEQRVNDVPAHLRDVTTVFQNYALFPHMTVYNNVAFGLVRRRVKRPEIRRRVTEVLQLVGLENLANRFPSALSGGQQQRVALARSLVLGPKVLLLDEPLSNLDAKLRKRMEVEIRNLLRRNNVTAIHVTHDQEEALTMSDEVAVMNAGKIEQLGSPEEIYRRPVNRWVAEFIGTSNILPLAEAKTSGQGAVSGRVGGAVARSAGPAEFGPSGEAWLLIRPEALKPRTGSELGDGESNRLRGQIVSSLYLGRCARLEVAVADTEHKLIVDAAGGPGRFREGDAIELEWDEDDSWVLTQ